MPVVSLSRPPCGAKVLRWGVVPAHNWYRRGGAVPFVYWPPHPSPALGLAGLAVLALLPGDAISVYRIGLCWLAFWVFQQMFQLDALIRGSFYVALAYALLAVCVGYFLCASALSFYILFELSLLPTLLMVLLFGYQPEKLRAGQYLLLYTVLASLPLLLTLLSLAPYLGWISLTGTRFVCLSLTLGFMVKSPLYLVHMWLPKAHVEAPVAASMALAGILLKLGSFGLLLFCPGIRHPLLTWYLAVSLLGAVACSLVCARQWDAKSLIAFSSVVHMGVVTVGVVVGSELGYLCGYLMVVAHGVCSPLLFGVAYRFYLGSHSRLLTANRGRLASPLASLILFLLLAVNMGVPPFLNLWSEVLMFCSLLAYAVHASWVLLPAALLAALYNLHLYVSLTHGKESASAAPWGELWASIHSVGLSLALAGGLGLFNGAYPVTLGAISTTPTVCRLSQSCHLSWRAMCTGPLVFGYAGTYQSFVAQETPSKSIKAWGWGGKPGLSPYSNTLLGVAGHMGGYLALSAPWGGGPASFSKFMTA